MYMCVYVSNQWTECGRASLLTLQACHLIELIALIGNYCTCLIARIVTENAHSGARVSDKFVY